MRIDSQILCLKTDISASEISRRLDKTPQAFSQKVKRGRLTIDDLKDIALVTGCKLECNYVLPNGEKIRIE